MVFQDAPLFPHLDVAGNVAFGLHGAGRAGHARSWLERVAAADLATRRVGELSGGQRQRVARARARAAPPAPRLLDEPFSALDAASRTSLGRLLVELQASSGIPFVHVTHDLNEALHLGTRLVLLDAGRVVQSGPPAEVLARPASLAAARAVGTENLLGGTVLTHRDAEGCSEVDLGGTRVVTLKLDLEPGARVTLGLRAEEILLALKPIHQTSARNVIAGTIEQIAAQGAGVELRVTTPAPFRVLVTQASVRELGLGPGTAVWLLIKATAFHRLF
jgi:molybdopterin-binding protein